MCTALFTKKIKRETNISSEFLRHSLVALSDIKKTPWKRKKYSEALSEFVLFILQSIQKLVKSTRIVPYHIVYESSYKAKNASQKRGKTPANEREVFSVLFLDYWPVLGRGAPIGATGDSIVGVCVGGTTGATSVGTEVVFLVRFPTPLLTLSISFLI